RIVGADEAVNQRVHPLRSHPARYYRADDAVFFFFQAEDGIRDSSVTGVQTCALPICLEQAGLYWLARMLEAGEDARFIARRLVILASEDVGMADSMGLVVANAAARAV